MAKQRSASSDRTGRRRFERLPYLFDNVMSRGTPALIGLLAMVSLVLIGIISGLVWLFDPESRNSQGSLVWRSMLRTLDPGTMGGDEGDPLFLALMLTVTVGGIFIVSALVGVLATGLDSRLADLRKGRSRLVERRHVVILGWSEQVFIIISELVSALDGQRGCVAILADQDKVAMEDAIRARVAHPGRVRVVCRTGNTTNPTDLDIVRLNDASVIIVPVPASAESDVQVVKTLLALHQRPWSAKRPPVIAAVADSKNLAAAKLAGGRFVTVIDSKDILARLVVQSRRQPGLSAVWAELLGFEGDEIYMPDAGKLVGSTYGDALFAHENATVFGISHADGTVELNPPSDTVIRTGDQLVVIARSAQAVKLAARRPPVDHAAIREPTLRPAEPEHTLILGWNDRGPTVVELLERYLPAGSRVQIAAVRDKGGPDESMAHRPGVTVTPCSPTDRAALDRLVPSQFHHVIVLAEDDVSPHHADSRTLVTLLHLRDMRENGGSAFAIVSELNDDANRRLAEVTRADDFVIGEKLISLYITQLSQNQHLSAVFAELFDARGSDIYLRPVDDYVSGDACTFATIIEAARRRGETAIGYRLKAQAYQEPGYGVVLNPGKHQPIEFLGDDRIVVVARIGDG